MNKIFKTIWNRARRCYVAVNETVCGAAQADGFKRRRQIFASTASKVFTMTAVAFAVVTAHAETITESGSISGTYDNLTLGGHSELENIEIQRDSYIYARDHGIFGRHTYSSRPSSIPYSSSLFPILENEYKKFQEWHQAKFGTTPRINYQELKFSQWGSFGFLPYIDGYYDYVEFFLWAYSDQIGTSFDLENLGRFTVGQDEKLDISGSLTLGEISVDANIIFNSVGGSTSYRSGTNSDTYTIRYYESNSTVSETITSNATLENNGGTVDIGGDLILENPENTYTQNGGSTSIDGIGGEGSVIINDGTLSTSGGVLIEISEAKAAEIGAYELFDPSQAVTVTSLAAGEKSKVSGMSAQSDQFTINGGTLNIEGTYEQHIADQAEQLLKDYYGQNINVTFDEIVADQTLDRSNGYTTAVLNSIYDENRRGDVLFHSLNWNAQSQNLVIGDGDMVRNIGVKNIDNAASVTVTNGKTFAILGDGTGTTVNGVFTADNGNLVFGAAGLTSGGTVSSVSMLNDANVTVANGSFVFGSLAGEGNFSVAQTGTADLSDYVVNGRFTNDGSTTISGDLTFADGSEMTSSGNLTTGLDNVFQNVTPSVVDPLKVIGLNASLPEEIRTVASDLFRKYVPGEVADVLADHATFSGGKVTITGVDLTNTQVADLTQAFKEQTFSRASQANASPVALS